MVAYSSWVSPLSKGRKRFHRPRSRALAFSASTTGGTVVSRAGLLALALVDRLGGSTSSRMKASIASWSFTAAGDGAG